MVAGHMTKKNGYWYLILMVRDETGRLKQKWISTHLRVEGNKKKAEAMLLAARREYTDFAEIQKRSSDVLVSHYLTTWVKSCRGKVSFGTYEEYQNCINNRIAPYFKERNILLLDLKPADILDYYNSLYAKGLTGNTVLHYHVLLRKALKEASMRGFIQNDPTDFIPRPKKEQSAADCYSPEECRKLLNALHDDPLELPITLAVLYGLRRSEVLGLRWGAIDYERATITISHSVTSTAVNGKRQLIAKDKLKRKSSFRTLPLMPQVAAMLQNAAIQRYGTQPPPNEEYICVNGTGQLFTPDYLSEHFKTILAKNNLRRIRFHDLRHPYVKHRLILMLGEKLAELVSFIGEDKAEALSVHSAIESDFHVCHLKRKCLGFYMQSQCAYRGTPAPGRSAARPARWSACQHRKSLWTLPCGCPAEPARPASALPVPILRHRRFSFSEAARRT